jgi:Carbohydrate kinase
VSSQPSVNLPLCHTSVRARCVFEMRRGLVVENCESLIAASTWQCPTCWVAFLQAVADALEGPIVLAKGSADSIAATGHTMLKTSGAGSPRRCGGQGDILSGVTATTISWALMYASKVRPYWSDAARVAVITHFLVHVVAACQAWMYQRLHPTTRMVEPCNIRISTQNTLQAPGCRMAAKMSWRALWTQR